MPDSSVSSCVLNVLGSFSSSLGLYKKLKEGRQKKRRYKRNPTTDAEELRLSKSLRQGPEDISQEYQRSIFAVGDQFAIGDAIAQTSLAEILLRLNVGLIGIITSFLHNDRNDVQLDYKALADMSDRSRVDTCRTLRQLFKRLTQLKRPLAITSRDVNDVDDHPGARQSSELRGERKKTKGRTARGNLRGPTLAQVVIQDSSRPPQIAMVRPGERRKKSRSSSGSDSSLSKSRSETKSASEASTPPPQYAAEQPQRQEVECPATARVSTKHTRKHSSTNIPSKIPVRKGETLRTSKSTPRLDATLQEPWDPLPPMPHSAPLPAATSTPDLAPFLPRRRKPTPTYYSIATDSTKLGEIPLHKWASQVDFDRMSILNQEAYRNGWPNEPTSSEVKKKRAGLFGLFRRRTD